MLDCNIILSATKDGLIGNDNDLIFDVSKDKNYFKEITSATPNEEFNNVVMMGRKTWESIPIKYRPLKNRMNVIISNEKYNEYRKNKNIFVFKTLDLALEAFRFKNGFSYFWKTFLYNQIFIIGGGRIYNEILEKYKKKEINVRTMYLTEIEDKDLDMTKMNNPIYFKMNEIDKLFIKKSQYKTLETNFKSDYLKKNVKKLGLSFNVYEGLIKIKGDEVGIYDDYYDFNILNLMENSKKFNKEEFQYLKLMDDLINKGDKRNTRNGVTISDFGVRMEFNLENDKIPILTTKKMAIKTVIKELLWFVKGSTNNKELQDQNVKIWNGNSSREFLDSRGLTNNKEGDLGPIYGFQWRHSGAKYIDCDTDYRGKGVDQLKNCIELIRKDPMSRRMIVCAWNPSDLGMMALPPCHILFQFYVSSDGKLSLQLYQRSGDIFLGVPFNILSYSLLLYMICELTNLKPGKFIHIIGDCHAYETHVDAIKEQIKRIPNEFPKIKINKKRESLDDFKLDDFEIIDYLYHDRIVADMVA